MSIRLFLLIIILLSVFSPDAYGIQEKNNNDKIDKSEGIYVKIGENQTIRDISAKYLHDPDLWEAILHINSLSSAHEICPGTKLFVPTKSVLRANAALKTSEELVRQAIETGAELFAPQQLSWAITLKNEAKGKRKSGQWEECTALANAAAGHARNALDISESSEKTPGEAVVEYCEGQVHRRSPSNPLWKKVSAYDTLKEGERIRTLANSYAIIFFRDNSRLYLKENSQALIRKMRGNVIGSREKADVSLIKGDVLALLADRKKQALIKINGKPVFQETEMPDTPASSVEKRLPAPILIAPDDHARHVDSAIEFRWKPVTGADAYLLEISRDENFSEIISTHEEKTVMTRFPFKHGDGGFYWRVRAISANKVPGSTGKGRFIQIIQDQQPPFLVVYSPEADLIFGENTIEVQGQTEQDAAITIHQTPVSTNENGEFRYSYPLSPGENIILIASTDKSGNVNEIKRKIMFLPAKEIPFSFDMLLVENENNSSFPGSSLGTKTNHFLPGTTALRAGKFPLSGKTLPYNKIIVLNEADGSVSARTAADDTGRFHLNLPLHKTQPPDSRFLVQITDLTGRIKEVPLHIEIDDSPPVIQTAQPIPAFTNAAEFLFEGTVADVSPVSLMLNDRLVSTDNGRFSEMISLTPGKNLIQLLAQDKAGNIARLEKEIFSDAKAPRILSYDIVSETVNGRKETHLELQAADVSGTRKVAPFKVKIGDYQYKDVLIKNSSPGNYIASFYIPDGIIGKVIFQEVILSDYMGNQTLYEIGE